MMRRQKPDPECEWCGGTGEIAVDERDRDGNIARGTGSQKCECTIPDEAEEDPQD